MNKILQLCEKNGFLKPFFRGKSLEYLAFGPTGELLVNNIKDEWVYSCVTNSSTNVFPFYGGSTSSGDISLDAKDSFSYVKNLCRGYLPFGLTEIRHQPEEICSFVGTAQSESLSKENAFKLSKGMVLRSIQFLSPDDANRFFTTWQRERKVWWRKFSSCPGRFKLSEVTSTDLGVNGAQLPGQCVQILSDFEWGTIVVEKVRLWPPSTFAPHGKLFELRDGKHTVLPCALESVLTLDVAGLVYLCDAFDDKIEDNIMMRLHRRIAPFKVSFTADVSKNLVSKAYDLAQHLTLVLRRAGHATLLLPKIGEEPIKTIASYNQLGVPFTVVLTDSSLSDGIIELYSRETSLKEQVHITQLVDYMNQLIKAST